MTNKIKTGDLIQTKSGDWHLVLTIEDRGFVQEGFNGQWGTQGRNEPQCERITVYDGYKFINRYSYDEIKKIYSEIRRLKVIEFEKQELI